LYQAGRWLPACRKLRALPLLQPAFPFFKLDLPEKTTVQASLDIFRNRTQHVPATVRSGDGPAGSPSVLSSVRTVGSFVRRSRTRAQCPNLCAVFFPAASGKFPTVQLGHG
jgi:hypothetical protein